MSRIYVEFARLKQLGDSCKTVSSKVDGIRSDFQHTVSQLDWDVKFMSDINNTANQLTKKLERYIAALKVYQSFVFDAYNKYSQLDSYKDKLDTVNIKMNLVPDVTPSPSRGDLPSSDSESSSIWDVFTNLTGFVGNWSDMAELMTKIFSNADWLKAITDKIPSQLSYITGAVSAVDFYVQNDNVSWWERTIGSGVAGGWDLGYGTLLTANPVGAFFAVFFNGIPALGIPGIFTTNAVY